MRKMFVFMLALAIVLLTGCSSRELEMSDAPIQSDIVSVPQTEIKEDEDEGVTSSKATESTTVPDRDSNLAFTPETPAVRDEESEKETTANEPLPSQSSSSNNSVVSKEANDSTSSETMTTPQETETQIMPIIIRARKEDSLEVANRVLYYINEFRDAPAAYLPGLAEYAQYRSIQLISNFAHDTSDQRAAATELQYGEYVDPSIFCGNGKPYYCANAREAIAKAGYVGTVDEVAHKLASLVKNSKGHWNYIGSSEYTCIAVGVTYESGMWYCAIEVTFKETVE